MKRSPRSVSPMGASVFRDLLRRVDTAVTLDELRALRRFSHRRLENDERIATLDEAIERKAMTMIAEAEAAGRDPSSGHGGHEEQQPAAGA
ncbi:MAG TPA: hypothetical protein VM076_16985 [Gemmatimonadaceae bacterium]|nr:hypothetical protein [Gemmatimonadaceae bacterium]